VLEIRLLKGMLRKVTLGGVSHIRHSDDTVELESRSRKELFKKMRSRARHQA
jgi:hypothetical protein